MSAASSPRHIVVELYDDAPVSAQAIAKEIVSNLEDVKQTYAAQDDGFGRLVLDGEIYEGKPGTVTRQTVDAGDALEVCQAANAWAGYLRDFDHGAAADRIDQAVQRIYEQYAPVVRDPDAWAAVAADVKASEPEWNR